MGEVDEDVAGLPVEEGDRAVAQVHVLGQGLEHRLDHLGDVRVLVEDAAELVEELELLDLAALAVARLRFCRVSEGVKSDIPVGVTAGILHDRQRKVEPSFTFDAGPAADLPFRPAPAEIEQNGGDRVGIRRASREARRPLGATPWAATLLIAAAIALSATGPASAQVEIDNDLSVATPGYWAVAVEDEGHLSRGLVTALRPGTGELIAALDVLASQGRLVRYRQ